MINKRGQGLSVNAIILIILAVVVLVMLIIGFTAGWDQLAPWVPSNNVDTIVQQCGIVCSTAKIYDYCSVNRTLKAEDLDEDLVKTCNQFALNYPGYGIANCSAAQPC